MSKPLRISFNGAVAPYYYRCPHSYKLRNIDRIYPPREPEPEPDAPLSPRAYGILQHKLTAAWLSDTEAPPPEHVTESLQGLRTAFEDGRDIHVEEDIVIPLEVLSEAPEGSVLTLRPDYFEVVDGHLDLWDFKFGDPLRGAAQYYEECDFFVFGLLQSGRYDIGSVDIHIHFPADDYTLPLRSYDTTSLPFLVNRWDARISRIISDRFCAPIPSRLRCDFCDYRAESSGGTGDCEHALV
jgi:hypothetical protein